MTSLLNDILCEPQELSRMLTHTTGAGRPALDAAARIVRDARHLYVTGIGSSWHAGMAVAAAFEATGRPCQLCDASELLHFMPIPAGSAVIMLSRSGRSFEIVNLLAKTAEAGARVIAVTNTPEGPLAQQADAVLHMRARFDHLVSVSMYSGLVMVGCLLASAVADTLDASLQSELDGALHSVGERLEGWRQQIEAAHWISSGSPTCFLARGGSLASCHEARLLWEEAAKESAAAMTTGGFRHGPQEVVREDFRLGLWIDPLRMRDEDLTLAEDVRRCGAKVFVVGHDLPSDCGHLVVDVPATPPSWQPVIDIVPAQIAAEYLSRQNGENCDAFRLCPYIVANAGGLNGK